MPSFVGSPYVIRPRVYDDATERLAAAIISGGGGLSRPQKVLYDQLILRLKANALWEKLDAFYALAAENSVAALINVRNPGTFDATAVNSPTFTAGQGFTGNGTSAYLRSNFNPSTAGGQFAQNSASFGGRSRTAGVAAGNQSCIVSYLSSNHCLIPRNGGDVFFARINELTGQNSGANVITAGHFAAVRSGATTQEHYINGVSVFAGTAGTTVTPPNDTIVFGARVSSGDFTAKQMASAFIGGALNSTEVAALYAAELAYMQAVGAA